jgi:hypothetical protein
MALNNSGPISLGGSTSGQSVNLELGKSATAQISFNDAAVRTLTGTSSNTALIMPTNFYGKSNILDTQTVTVGGSGTIGNADRIRGYTSGLGSIVDGTSNIYGGAAIASLFWNENNGDYYYFLAIVGATNSGWTTLTIGTKTLNRADATFGTGANWTWPTADNIFTQAFGAISSTVVCTFA